jgi:hypothetical protein
MENEKVINRPKSAIIIKKVPKGTIIEPPLPKLKKPKKEKEKDKFFILDK